MSEKHLAIYLNDHLAGSVTALELLETLEKVSPGTPLEIFIQELRAEIEQDRDELQCLMKRLSVTPSLPRRAVAWVLEWAVEVKLKVDDSSGGALRLLESLEAVSLGIEGKRSLWKSLEAASAMNTGLKGPDYKRLIRRATKQRIRIESWRLDAASSALAVTHKSET